MIRYYNTRHAGPYVSMLNWGYYMGRFELEVSSCNIKPVRLFTVNKNHSLGTTG